MNTLLCAICVQNAYPSHPAYCGRVYRLGNDPQDVTPENLLVEVEAGGQIQRADGGILPMLAVTSYMGTALCVRHNAETINP